MSISKLPNGRWQARYRDSTKKQYARNFTRKVDAQQWLKEVTTAQLTGMYVDPRRSRSTVESVALTWLDSNPDWSASTRARNCGIVDNHIVPKWGPVKLVDVDFESLQQWVSDLTTSMAGGSVRKVAGVMSSILNTAVAAKRLAANPMAGVKLPKQDLARRRYLSAGEVEALADAAGDRRPIVLTLAYCGLRIGELAALRVGNVDQVRRRLQIDRSVTEVNGALVWSSPKDHQRRSVPYPKFMDATMSDLLEDRGPDELLFPAPRGGALRVRNMRRDWFDGAVKSAGIGTLTPHELRHTAASIAVSSGASVLALQRMLGHEKASVTLDVYSDLFDEDLDAVMERMTSAREDYLRTAAAEGLRAISS